MAGDVGAGAALSADPIACIGVLTLDRLARGETAHRGPFAAGNAVYAAIGAWLTGGVPVVVARAGNDYPRAAIAALALRGIAVEIRDAARRSLAMFLDEGADGRRVRYDPSGGLGEELFVAAADLCGLRFRSAHVCAGQSERELEIVEHLSRTGLRTTLDLVLVEGRPPPCRDRLLAAMAGVEAFMPSVAELRRLWPRRPLNDVVDMLHDAGCRSVVVKMGPEGCLGSDGRRRFHMPPVPADVVDATGAGDAYCGAFHGEWMRGRCLPAAMAAGAAAASVVIEGYGALHAASDAARMRAGRRRERALATLREIPPAGRGTRA